MKKQLSYLLFFVCTILLMGSCRAIQPILVLRPNDFLEYGFFYLLFSVIFSALLCNGKKKKFWLWLLANIFLTPIFGLIMTIIKSEIKSE